MNYYVSRGGKQYGPYSLAEVQKYMAEGSISPGDHAWTETMASWVPLSQLLADLARPATRRYCPRCDAQVSHDAEACPSCQKALYEGGHPARLAGLFGWLWGALIAGIVFGVVKGVEVIAGFSDRTIEMAVFVIVFLGASHIIKSRLVARHDLGVWEVSSERPDPEH